MFNINPPKADGFVIVVADDAMEPVIGYSTEGSFKVPQPFSVVNSWMGQRKDEIIANRLQNIRATESISARWSQYLTKSSVAPKLTGSVSPLLLTAWDQPYPYNALCPSNCPTGCVATAMAQIMRYWKYPLKGIGSSSYNSSYGILSANYGNTVYNWNNMPVGKVTGANTDVATIMYHCGVSVDMSYSPNASGAYVTTYENPSVCAQISYSKYFGYDAGSIKGLQEFNYSSADWINLIENELNSSRPIQYVGYDTIYGGHSWVCDGYDPSNNLHMNWGWSGVDNGYFAVTSLNPGGTYNFGTGQEVIVGIMPKASATYDAGVLTVISPSAIYCTSGITPEIQLENFGTDTLTSCTINYYVDSNTPLSYNWTGLLASGSYANVTLPSMTVASGIHSFSSYTSNPDGKPDGNTANDLSTISFTIVSSPPSLPMSQGFEGNSFLPAGWAVENPDNDATWQIVTTVAHTGTNCIGMNNCDGDGSTDMTGTYDRFIIMPYSFSDVLAATLSFDVAYTPVVFNSIIYADTLAVYYSVNCGSDWTRLYSKGGTALATAPAYNANNNPGCWQPTSTQWRTDIINLDSLAGLQSVMLAFENHSGWGGWIYIDNINLSANSTTGVTSLSDESSFLVYPNPANTMFTVEVPRNLTDQFSYTLYTILGDQVLQGKIKGPDNHRDIDVRALAPGMYFLKISNNKRSSITKIIVEGH